MLVLAREIHDLGHLGFRNFIRIDAALPNAVIVHMQHDASRLFPVLLKKSLKNMDDEFHGRVVVIQQQNPIQAGSLGLGFRSGDDCRAAARPVTALLIALLHDKSVVIHAIRHPPFQVPHCCPFI